VDAVDVAFRCELGVNAVSKMLLLRPLRNLADAVLVVVLVLVRIFWNPAAVALILVRELGVNTASKKLLLSLDGTMVQVVVDVLLLQLCGLLVEAVVDVLLLRLSGLLVRVVVEVLLLRLGRLLAEAVVEVLLLLVCWTVLCGKLKPTGQRKVIVYSVVLGHVINPMPSSYAKA